jgi:hypothetical protein
MATTATIKKNIAKLEAALKSKATPKSLKPKLETQLVKSKAELSGMNKGTKPKTSSTKSTQTALQKLKAMVNKNKKYKTYKGAGVDLEKDADRPALKTGRRIAKESGKTYYEYRANRIDVKQPPKKYPKLEKGGYMAKGGTVDVEDIKYIMYGYFKAWLGNYISDEELVNSVKRKLGTKYFRFFKGDTAVNDSRSIKNSLKTRNNRDFLKENMEISLEEKSLEIYNSKNEKLEKGGYMADGGRLRWNNVSIHINKNTEEDMRNAGFSFEPNGNAPLYYNGKEVGFLSNFNGVMLNDEYVDQLVPMFNNFRGAGVWNYRGWKEDAAAKKRQYGSKMAKGGEMADDENFDRQNITLEISVPYNFKKVVKDEYNFTEFLSKTLTKKWFGNGVWEVKVIKKEKGGYFAEGGFVAVGEKDGYWTIMSKPTTEEKANEVIKMGVPRGEVGKVVTLKEAKDHKKVIGAEYLEKGGYMEKGGISQKEVAESNAEMVLSKIKEVKHHAQELSNVVSKNSDIEAWVVAKIERASTDLSDITHYLEFQTKKMAMGGEIHRTQD